jgi:hypothetical protein
MKVRATQDGVCKYYRTAGDVFDWPDDQPLPIAPYNWVERVSDDTPNLMQGAMMNNGDPVRVYECISCGHITNRRSRFCPDCGANADAAKDEERIEKERADAIEGIQGKQARPKAKIRAKGTMPMGTGGVVDKDKEV